MTDAISSAQSALSALTTSMAATANNVANLNTDGYKSKDVRLETGPQGRGVRVGQVAEDTAAGGYRPVVVSSPNEAGVSDPSAALVETSNVDLARQTVAMVETSRAFEANVAVVRTQDDMVGALLDLRV